MAISIVRRVNMALLKKSSKESILMSISSQFWFQCPKKLKAGIQLIFCRQACLEHLVLEYMNIVDRLSIHGSELHSK